jgi:hypothetical protein
MQYLASLNKDEPFKKVFSDIDIAKAFLEDMLNVTIENIKELETDHKITNAASVVRFDFRCQILGQDVIIEMQNDYYEGLVKRFYLYHCLSTGLQLEVIKDKAEEHPVTGREYLIKRYVELKPVISIIWMAENNLGFKEDFIEFNTYPKALADFIMDDDIWIGKQEALLDVRNQLLNYLQKKAYNLDFHAQNRLIYVFQNNVVKNNRHKRYAKWFEFAQKTRKKDNKATDFQPFINNLIFSKMIQRLTTKWMEPAELRAMIGDEAYFAAKELAEKDKDQKRLDKIYDQFYQNFGDQIEAEQMAAQSRLTMAYQKFGATQRAWHTEKAQLEQEKAQLEQEKKAEQEKAEQLLKFEKAKAKKEHVVLLKIEKEKAKKEHALLLKIEKEKAKIEKIALKEKLEKVLKEKQEQLLKAEKEKQEQLLKAEKEKQEQLLKAEKEKEHLLRLKMVRKMLDKGNSVETIADLLEVSVLQIQEWIETFKK